MYNVFNLICWKFLVNLVEILKKCLVVIVNRLLVIFVFKGVVCYSYILYYRVIFVMYKVVIGVKIKILIYYIGDKNIYVKVGLNKEFGRMVNFGKVFIICIVK